MKLRIGLLILLLSSTAAFAQAPPKNSVTITATASTQPAGVTVTGYNFYQTSTSGSGYSKIGSIGAVPISFTTPALDGGAAGGPGKTYFFVIRAFRDPCTTCTPAETLPVESANSVEISAFIAAPPLPPPPVPNAPTGVTTKVNP